MRLADGVLLVVDAAEGTMVVTEKVVKQALAEGLPITLLLTKARARARAPPRTDSSWGNALQGCAMRRARRGFFFFSLRYAFRDMGATLGVNLCRACDTDEHIKMHAMP